MAISLFHPGDRHTLRQTEDLNLRIGTATSVTCGCPFLLLKEYWKPTEMYWNELKRKEINMEVKNGIIIDGMLHELCVGICDECSLQNECDDSSEIICDIAYENPNMDQCFVNRGKVTDIKIDKEE